MLGVIRRKINVGDHLECCIWDSDPGVLAIHITRRLDEIDSDNIFGYTRELKKRVREDLAGLAVLLMIDPNLQSISTLTGMGAMPEVLGDQFGFSSHELPHGRIGQMLHHKSYSRMRLKGNTPPNGRLRRFTISREDFLELYAPEEPWNCRESKMR